MYVRLQRYAFQYLSSGTQSWKTKQLSPPCELREKLGRMKKKNTHKWGNYTTTTPMGKKYQINKQKPTKNLSLRFLKELKGIQTA